jgi:urease accessory protein
MSDRALLTLLQLTSPALPIGAYSYSEGLETLVYQERIRSAADLQLWLEESLATGSIGIDAAVLVRADLAWQQGDKQALAYWNDWLSATRETAELQQQNWQMGRSLFKLLGDLYPQIQLPNHDPNTEWNLAIGFAIATNLAQIDRRTAVLGYLHSWVSNLISAGVKLIPLGQTAGQQLLLQSQTAIETATDRALNVTDDRLFCCSWGLALASMAHETQYSRLFRS